MDDNNENDAQRNVRHPPASILDIPNEAFEIICSFLDTSTLMNLRLICKKFNSYINKISLRAWKRRAKYSIWSDAIYPILRPANPDKLFWRMSCVALQKQKTLCTQNGHPLVNIATEKYRIEAEYFLSCLRLIRKNDDIAYIVAKGHNLFYNKINSEHCNVYIKNAHRKPIRDLTILNDKIYSCSSDNEPIKSWKLNNSHFQMETSYNFNSGPSKDLPTCLSSYPGQDVFAVGSLYGFVSVFDSRLRNPMYKMRREDGYQIFTLAMNSKYILSAGYDHKVFVYDQRTRQVITDTDIGTSITCIKMQQNGVLIGDCIGRLHVLNPKNNFEVVNSYCMGHIGAIKRMHLTYGNLITSSTREVIISSPTDPPRHMYTLDMPLITSMDYQKGTLALANIGNQIRIYRFVR